MCGVHCSNQGMNTGMQHGHLPEDESTATQADEWFISLAIAMIVVTLIYLLVALWGPDISRTQAASANAAALTAGLC